jgi:hypothetical protein
MTIRIPAELADKFVATVSANANVVSSNETLDDVTLQYLDTESQVKALETEQEQLLELLDQAKSLEDILKIQDRLTQVRYELERYASRLRTLDNQIDYATIHLTIDEVKEYTPVVEEDTFWQRITTGFKRSIKNIVRDVTDFAVWVIVNSPYLLLWAVVGVVLIVLLRKRIPKRKKKSAPNQEQTE